MSILSGMTGFARTSGEASGTGWAWEAKSVNGRGLDVRVNVPTGLEQLERRVKSAAQKKLKRGSVQISLRYDKNAGSSDFQINASALAMLTKALESASGQTPSEQAIATLLTARGVLETSQNTGQQLGEDTAFVAAVSTGAENVVEQLIASRQDVGRALKDIMLRIISDMEKTAHDARREAATHPALIKERFEKQLTDIGAEGSVDAERLAAEVAISAAKADVREELDRLDAHLNTARNHLEQGSPIGRKLDFLAQELNREANTLCSKSIALDLTNAGLTLKGLIDQFKEQAANVE